MLVGDLSWAVVALSLGGEREREREGGANVNISGCGRWWWTWWRVEKVGVKNR